MVFFNQCEVKLNGTGLLANSASVVTNTNLLPMYSIGKRGVAGFAGSAPTSTTFNITYYLSPAANGDPNYNIVKALMDSKNKFQRKGVVLSVGGISADAYLTNFSFNVDPNTSVTATAGYTAFSQTTGSLSKMSASNTLGDVYASGIAHSWSTYISSRESSITNPSYSFSYNFSPKWEPINTIRSLNASSNEIKTKQVSYLGADESISVTRDQSYDVTFSGANAGNTLLPGETDKKINVNSIGLLCPLLEGSSTGVLSFDISNAKISSQSVEANVGDIVKTNITAVNNY